MPGQADVVAGGEVVDAAGAEVVLDIAEPSFGDGVGGHGRGHVRENRGIIVNVCGGPAVGGGRVADGLGLAGDDVGQGVGHESPGRGVAGLAVVGDDGVAGVDDGRDGLDLDVFFHRVKVCGGLGHRGRCREHEDREHQTENDDFFHSFSPFLLAIG
jgi:hypothetical protein